MAKNKNVQANEEMATETVAIKTRLINGVVTEIHDKTPEERMSAHVEKVLHELDRVGTWMDALILHVTSSKYPLSAVAVAKIEKIVDEKYNEFKKAVSQAEPAESKPAIISVADII